MSERMIPIPFEQLMLWIATEYQRESAVFGVHRSYTAEETCIPVFPDAWVETPVGPAAGPHTQLAQNIVTAYVTGARFFELKTVQQLDGEQLAACISRPCILAEDEGYNCEWSTELTVEQAFEEYVKAWCACKMLAHVYGLGDPDGFVFIMSVGYALAGIQSEKIDRFIEGMKDASHSTVWAQCMDVLHRLYPGYGSFVDTISPRVSGSITLSTLHGCPASEIEAIARYLLEQKQVHTFIKCNPTLLGYDTVRQRLDSLGFTDVSFTKKHFENDLQYEDAIPMFRRLRELAHGRGLEFGLKLSNTFPVEARRQELPSEEIYLSGKALYPLTVEMANRLAREFEGRMRLSYSGGADYFNIDRLYACGIWPITVCTTLLKPGGYDRMLQLAWKLDGCPVPEQMDLEALAALAAQAPEDPHYAKAGPVRSARKQGGRAPMLDCDKAPCRDGCPLGQDIPAYLALVEQGRYEEALDSILTQNPLPFITGSICYEFCRDSCTRRYYDRPVSIRKAKLEAAERGYEAVLARMTPPPVRPGRKTAIVGGGPTGMAAAHFLARSGEAVTLFEKETQLGGLVRRLLAPKQISHEAIDRDSAFLEKLGVEVKLNTPAPSLEALKEQGYNHILLAMGGWKKTLAENQCYYDANGVKTDSQGRLQRLTRADNVWAAGDCLRGVSSVAQGIADAAAFAAAVTGQPVAGPVYRPAAADYRGRRGVLTEQDGQCLGCQTTCQCCVDVCPNRANAVIELPDGRRTILHMDGMCNECGNCVSFCPYESKPFRDKFTLFHDRAAMEQTPDCDGFVPMGWYKVLVRCGGTETVFDLSRESGLDPDVETLIRTVYQRYGYLL